ncbi:hypothetical protein PSI9734_00382 [Pseudidiomarina piscicola]|uniref:DUF3301 domain-containing protein n=1 Tax=Pseudidiomarina piscicola TaxID=2614830 RepID=A0A6S6WM61_9GAMM|nr:DUF3301 domain-containing protein [Pseudidiomarina piscicola]CAB0149803.1 hypothetical protein PSI9734_00382 [Pseudidiomarina piscicola]VZT39251.1 hypothetical protein PSI9734_00382 [Pseudomonas aeruginosa]
MVLFDAILLIAIGFVGLLFWQGRRQAELARVHAKRYCEQHQLQFLDIAWQGGRLAKRGRHIGWKSHYQFAFSSDRESRYEGDLQMLNLRLLAIETPAYRLPD